MFVVFEGIDGSGKTTVSNRVAENLRARGVGVTHLRAGGRFASSVSEAIRELGRDARNLHLTPEAEFLLYAARDVQLVEQVLRPALGGGDLVIADRFLYTAEVLGRHGRHLPDSFTVPVLRAAAGDVSPDLVVLIDVDPALARARRKSAKLLAGDLRPSSRKGLAGVGLQHRLRRGYREMAGADPQRWVVVNNEEPLADVVARVTDLIDDARRSDVASALRRFRQPTGTAAPPRPAPRTADEALPVFLARVDSRLDGEPAVAAHLLGGLWGAPVDGRRRALGAIVPEAVLAGLEGLGDPVSWELRSALRARHPRAVALSLIRVPAVDGRAADLRLGLERDAPAEVAQSLADLGDDGALALRERLFDARPDAVMTSLGGLGSDRAWALRRRWMDAYGAHVPVRYTAAQACAKSVTGLDDADAWQMRRQARDAAPVVALASLAGLTSDRAWRWRQNVLLRAPKVVMGSLYNMRDGRAWEMRRAVVDDCKEALDSVFGMDDPEAWDLREAHCDRWPSTVIKTLGPLAATPRGRALVERQLARHPDNLSLLKHAAAVALGTAFCDYNE